MIIETAEFIMSNSDIEKCPPENKPEYAFIGRSNVGKSSLINMLTARKKLAKTSSKPGKTQLVNHFLINQQWYLVDLPGYGFAKVAKNTRQRFNRLIYKYIENRSNLIMVFVLIDSRHSPQEKDAKFMAWLGENEIPFAIVFTKTDKLSKKQLAENIDIYKQSMLETWEEMPPCFESSSTLKSGRNEILEYIEKTNQML